MSIMGKTIYTADTHAPTHTSLHTIHTHTPSTPYLHKVHGGIVGLDVREVHGSVGLRVEQHQLRLSGVYSDYE